MRITVVLCTYNRCESLAKALDSLAASDLPKNVAWEVLVVDNNSKDETRGVVAQFSQRHPGRFRYFFEPQQGKSFALNSGIRESRADVLAFVDDDVIVERGWLHDLTSVLFDNKWAGSGGRILPPPSFVPPEWLALSGPRNLGVVLCAQFDFGTTPGQLKDAPFGTNMAFRREMFDHYGVFRTDLGPRPGSEVRNEDTEFGRRLMAGGERLYYVPSAVVYHEVHPDRVRKEFFLRWWFDHGRGAIREAGVPGATEILKLILTTVKTALGSVLSPDRQRRFYRRCMLWQTAGRLFEAWHQAKQPGRKLKGQPEAS
jgi:glucosyl-dolichyl phosphate glucuronosyltransferase